jgi:hypothetical protein
MARKKSPEVEVVVTVAQEHLSKVKQVAARLEAQGLKVTNTMEGIGMISGKAPHAALGDLNKVDGVAAVELSGSVKIAPPESEIQ